MKYVCIDVHNGEFLGHCILPNGKTDPDGTEHRFGEIDYRLLWTTVRNNEGIMYFNKIKTVKEGVTDG